MTRTGEVLVATTGIQLVRIEPPDQALVERLQFAAYAANRELLGLEPVPLLADYGDIMRTHEVWALFQPGSSDKLSACLILETNRSDDLLIWSVSTSPTSQRSGLGRALLQCAEVRARELGRDIIRLYTGEALTHLIDWYARNGYAIERTEKLEDRTLVHMMKTLR